MVNIDIFKIHSYSFTGALWASDLGLCSRDDDRQLDVVGDFTVTFDDEHPELVIESVAYFFGGNWIELDESAYDYDECCDHIANRGDVLRWYEDHIAGMADYYYDMMQDR